MLLGGRKRDNVAPISKNIIYLALDKHTSDDMIELWKWSKHIRHNKTSMSRTRNNEIFWNKI